MKVPDVAKKMAKTLDRGGSCGVVGCSNGDAEYVELEPFDPIDHDGTLVRVCPTHQVWAEERNEFAEEMTDLLRERRKEIGMENIDRVQELAAPQGEMREDILDGSATGMIPLSDAFESDALVGDGE